MNILGSKIWVKAKCSKFKGTAESTTDIDMTKSVYKNNFTSQIMHRKVNASNFILLLNPLRFAPIHFNFQVPHYNLNLCIFKDNEGRQNIFLGGNQYYATKAVSSA